MRSGDSSETLGVALIPSMIWGRLFNLNVFVLACKMQKDISISQNGTLVHKAHHCSPTVVRMQKVSVPFPLQAWSFP